VDSLAPKVFRFKMGILLSLFISISVINTFLTRYVWKDDK